MVQLGFLQGEEEWLLLHQSLLIRPVQEHEHPVAECTVYLVSIIRLQNLSKYLLLT